MDFLDLAKKRYSVRSYKKTPVEEEKVACILEAARVARRLPTYSRHALSSSTTRREWKSSAVRQMSTARLSPSSCARTTRKLGSAQLTARALLTSMRQSPPTT